ncbi:MAG: ribosome silencing factor [Rhodothermales bacterium]|nr:ribosome silencing factor [Rhodothermales bacterium]
MAVEAALSKKGENVVVMSLEDVTGMADYFVICEGTSDLQVKAVANAVKDTIKEQTAERPWHSEGLDTWQWVLLDYVDVVVHIMAPEKREYYGLERLWGDAKSVGVPDDASLADVRSLIDSLAQ